LSSIFYPNLVPGPSIARPIEQLKNESRRENSGFPRRHVDHLKDFRCRTHITKTSVDDRVAEELVLLQCVGLFCSYWSAALRGEELLDAEAESRHQPWASPIDIARLLLMRSNPKTVRPEKRNSSPRILGVILPELETVVAKSGTSLPSPDKPILPLNLRPALLAGIAIVERAGPAILEMLHACTRRKPRPLRQARRSNACPKPDVCRSTTIAVNLRMTSLGFSN
jgi:hypothetical protein